MLMSPRHRRDISLAIDERGSPRRRGIGRSRVDRERWKITSRRSQQPTAVQPRYKPNREKHVRRAFITLDISPTDFSTVDERADIYRLARRVLPISTINSSWEINRRWSSPTNRPQLHFWATRAKIKKIVSECGLTSDRKRVNRSKTNRHRALVNFLNFFYLFFFFMYNQIRVTIVKYEN